MGTPPGRPEMRRSRSGHMTAEGAASQGCLHNESPDVNKEVATVTESNSAGSMQWGDTAVLGSSP